MVFSAAPQNHQNQKPKNKPGLPSKDGKDRQRANAGKRAKELHAIQEKQELLAQLTKQAEENTRILEREKAKVLAERNSQQASFHEAGAHNQGYPFYSPPQQADPHHQHMVPPPPQRAKQTRGRRAPQASHQHIFSSAERKVFNPSQVPGLGGDAASSRQRQPQPSTPPSPLNGTFPDSPSFYPGMVFAIPSSSPVAAAAPQGHSQQSFSPVLLSPQQQHMRGGQIRGQQQQQMQFAPHIQQGPGISKGPQESQRGYGKHHDQLNFQQHSQHAMQQQQYSPRHMGQQQHHNNHDNSYQQHNNTNQQQQPYNTLGSGGEMPTLSGPLQHGMGSPVGGHAIGQGMELPWRPPPVHVRMQPAASPSTAYDPAQQRVEAGAKKDAYRRELEEQIRLKREAKEREAHVQRREQERMDARNAAEPPPWDPSARAARRGGGGEPLRDMQGNAVADLRYKSGSVPSPHGQQPYGSPHGQQGPMLGQGGFGGSPGRQQHHTGGPLRLTVEVPTTPQGDMQQQQQQGFMHQGPPFSYPHEHMHGPCGIPPVSPGNRRFLAAMSDLIAGPSDDQRRAAEASRAQLQADLQEQIREKRDRQARERAQRDRERQMEEAEFRATQTAGPGGPPRMQGRTDGGGMQTVAAAPAPPDDDPHHVGRRRGNKHIIDASWLDAAPLQQPIKLPVEPVMAAGHAVVSGGGVGPKAGRRRTAMGDEGPIEGPPPLQGLTTDGIKQQQQSLGIGINPVLRQSHQHAANAASGAGQGQGAGRSHEGPVTQMLAMLHEEQARMREEFGRQAAAMEKLAGEAGKVMVDRDTAWQELGRVKAMLAGGALPSGPPGSRLLAGQGSDPLPMRDAVDRFVVSTHLVPKTLNTIPDQLPDPLASEFLQSRYTDPGPGASHAGAGPYAGPDSRRASQAMEGAGVLPPELGRMLDAMGAYPGAGLSPGGYQGPSSYHQQQLQARLNPQRAMSGIPLPPGLGGPKGHHLQRRLAAGVPDSRYNSFFGLESEVPRGAGSGGGGMGSVMSGGGAAAAGFGPLGGPPARRPGHLRPPASPAILRGDHLPSPIKQPSQATRSARVPTQGSGGGAAEPAAASLQLGWASAGKHSRRARVGEKLHRTGHLEPEISLAGGSGFDSFDSELPDASDSAPAHLSLAALKSRSSVGGGVSVSGSVGASSVAAGAKPPVAGRRAGKLLSASSSSGPAAAAAAVTAPAWSLTMASPDVVSRPGSVLGAASALLLSDGSALQAGPAAGSGTATPTLLPKAASRRASGSGSSSTAPRGTSVPGDESLGAAAAAGAQSAADGMPMRRPVRAGRRSTNSSAIAHAEGAAADSGDVCAAEPAAAATAAGSGGSADTIAEEVDMPC